MKWLICLLAVFILWLLLFWSAGPAVLGTGAFFALIIGTCLGSIYPDRIYKVLDLRRWFYIADIPSVLPAVLHTRETLTWRFASFIRTCPSVPE